MILELADGPRKRKTRYISVGTYTRKKTVAAHRRRRPVLNSGDNHVYVPAHLFDGVRGMWVREDKFDGLSESEWDITMNELLEYQPGMSDLSGKARRAAKKQAKAEKKAKRAVRKDEKKALKLKKKADRNQRKNDRRAAIDAKRKAKGDAKVIRAEAKQDRANRPRGGGGSDADDDEETSTGRGIFANIISKGKGLINKIKGSPAPEGGEEPEGAEGGGDESNDSGADADGFDVFGMKIPKVVAYGGGALLIGGILYVATRKK